MKNIPFDHTEIPLFHDISSDELNAMLSCLHSYRKIFRKAKSSSWNKMQFSTQALFCQALFI